MYKKDSALNDLQWLICRENKPSKQKTKKQKQKQNKKQKKNNSETLKSVDLHLHYLYSQGWCNGLQAILANLYEWVRVLMGAPWIRPCAISKQKTVATVVDGDQKAPFSIATTSRCRGGHYSFPWIAPLYPWHVPYIADC